MFFQKTRIFQERLAIKKTCFFKEVVSVRQTDLTLSHRTDTHFPGSSI